MADHPPSPGAQAVATAITEAGNGLKGWYKTVANMTAVGVALVIVVAAFWFLMDSAREDRKATRDYIQQIQNDHKESIKDAKISATEAAKDAKEAAVNASREQKERSRDMETIHTRSFEKLGERIDKLAANQEKATQALVDATKAIKDKN